MSTNEPTEDLSMTEWLAWQRIVIEFARAPPEAFADRDFNNPKLAPLINAIKAWGEHLAVHRHSQVDLELDEIAKDVEGEYGNACIGQDIDFIPISRIIIDAMRKKLGLNKPAVKSA